MRGFDYEQQNQGKWDSETLLLIGNLRELKGRQEVYLLQKPTEWGRVKDRSLFDCVEGMNALCDLRLSSRRIRQVLASKGAPKGEEEILALGYAQTLRFVREHYQELPVKASYLLDLHRRLLLGQGGRLKDEQNYMSERRADGRSFVRFLPPSPYDTPEAVFSLCNALSKAFSFRVGDPLLVALEALGDFLCIYPFNAGNEQMACLLLTLLLLQTGYRVVEYVSIEKLLQKRREEYFDALKESSRGWHEGRNDALPLQKFFLRSLIAAYQEFESMVGSVCAKASALVQVRAAVVDRGGQFTKRDILLACPSLGRASVENALRQMVTRGELVRRGVGKATYYTRF